MADTVTCRCGRSWEATLLRTVGPSSASPCCPACGAPLTSPAPPTVDCQPSEVIDYLKQPTCVGDAADRLRGALGKRFGRSFADQWDMVEWLRANRRDLDLDAPPRRFGP